MGSKNVESILTTPMDADFAASEVTDQPLMQNSQQKI
jgi:hypothetical protein